MNDDKSIPEIKQMINDCLHEDSAVESKLEYLMRVLAYPRYQGMTVKEIFEAELNSKEQLEEELARRKTERELIVDSWKKV